MQIHYKYLHEAIFKVWTNSSVKIHDYRILFNLSL